MNHVVTFVGFALCASVIFAAGRGLSRYGQRIAEVTGMGGAWVGLVLMASVTSLPELAVGVTSAGFVGSADLAVGDVIGSCAFNLLILASLDAFAPRHRRLLGMASASHVLAAALGIILLALVGLGIVNVGDHAVMPWIGVSSVLFIGVYLTSVRLMFVFARRPGPDGSVQEPLDEAVPDGLGVSTELTTRQVVGRYAAHAAIVVAAAIALPPLAQRIAHLTGLEESFVGTLFLAASTSLPEIAVSLTAVRMGAINLAVGNMLGSNLFNIFILAIDDIVYTGGLLLQDASESHIVSVLSTITMSAVVIIGLTFHIEGKRFLLAWDAALILLIYAANAALLLAL